MAKLLKLRRGTTTQHGSFTGAEGEVTVDTDKETLVVHDGSTAGGHPVAAEDMANVSSASIAGRLATDSIAVGKIAAGTLPSDVKVADANISGNLTIESADIVDGTIVAADLASNSVVEAKIADNAVTTNKIATNAVTTTKIAADAIINSLIADNAVETANIANNQVTTAKIANGAVTVNELGATAVTNPKLATNAVGAGNLQQNAVETAKIQDDAVTYAKIQNVAQDRILGRQSAGGGSIEELNAANVRTLINVENGATADQTASEIVTLINGQTITPAHVHVGTGRIGGDSNDYIAFADNAHMDVVINGSTEFRFEADGDFHADGDVYAFSTTTASDENLKKDITIVGDAVSKVEALKGVTFKWKKSDAESAGVIAQDVEKVLPEVVKTVQDPDGNQYKAVNYSGITSILIEAVKDLSARIKVLEAK